MPGLLTLLQQAASVCACSLPKCAPPVRASKDTSTTRSTSSPTGSSDELAAEIRRLARPAGELFDHKADTPVSRPWDSTAASRINRTYIDPVPVAASRVDQRDVLEVAGNEYSTRHSARARAHSSLHQVRSSDPGVGDRRPDPGPDRCRRRVDCFVCTQTFDFIFDVHAGVHGAAHLLVDGGHLLATVGASRCRRYDMDRWGDYWRLSTAACERLFAESFSSVQVSAFRRPGFGGRAAAQFCGRRFAVALGSRQA